MGGLTFFEERRGRWDGKKVWGVGKGREEEGTGISI